MYDVAKFFVFFTSENMTQTISTVIAAVDIFDKWYVKNATSINIACCDEQKL